MNHVAIGIHCTLQKNGQYLSDGNCSIAINGKPVFAIAEERLSRNKYDGHFYLSLRHILNKFDLTVSDIDEIGVSTFGHTTEGADDRFNHIHDAISSILGTHNVPIKFMMSHHEAHAFLAAAYNTSEDLIVAVIDNEGSVIGKNEVEPFWLNRFERTSYYRFKNNKVSLLERDHNDPGEVGYGKVYSKITKYIGFKSYHDAGKTMGLAPFGNKDAFSHIPLFVEEDDGGEKCFMNNSVSSYNDVRNWFERHGCELMNNRQHTETIRTQDADLAQWVQESLEKSVCRRLTSIINREKPESLALAGGVALNSVMNSYLRKMLNVNDVTVPLSPGDAGLSLGVLAWLEWCRTSQVPKYHPNPYLGNSYSSQQINTAIASFADDIDVIEISDLASESAQCIARGEIIAWFQGSAEFGPRALGHRSIFADPRNPWTKEVLNNQVKRREWFRPFAPAVNREDAAEFFLSPFNSPYMMHVAEVHPHKIGCIPSAVHFDGTARLQVVDYEIAPEYSEFIRAVGKLTGVPVILNTSFNLGGEPIVETPKDAINTLIESQRIDSLFLGNYKIVCKK